MKHKEFDPFNPEPLLSFRNYLFLVLLFAVGIVFANGIICLLLH